MTGSRCAARSGSVVSLVSSLSPRSGAPGLRRARVDVRRCGGSNPPAPPPSPSASVTHANARGFRGKDRIPDRTEREEETSLLQTCAIPPPPPSDVEPEDLLTERIHERIERHTRKDTFATAKSHHGCDRRPGRTGA